MTEQELQDHEERVEALRIQTLEHIVALNVMTPEQYADFRKQVQLVKDLQTLGDLARYSEWKPE